jgi:hypothetical protein
MKTALFGCMARNRKGGVQTRGRGKCRLNAVSAIHHLASMGVELTVDVGVIDTEDGTDGVEQQQAERPREGPLEDSLGFMPGNHG